MSVVCKCYGKEQTYETREQAEQFYFECMMCSEGAERDRYVNIYCQLRSGYQYCTDEE